MSLPQQKGGRRRGFSLADAVIALLAASCVVLLLVPVVAKVQDAADRTD